MQTRQLIPLLLLVGLVGLSYHSLTASPSHLAPLNGHRDRPGDQETDLSWVVEQFRLAAPVAACHPSQPLRTHIARHVRALRSDPRAQFRLSWPDTATFLRRTIDATPRHRTEWAHGLHTRVHPDGFCPTTDRSHLNACSGLSAARDQWLRHSQS